MDLFNADTKASEAAAKELVERAKVEATFWGSEWGSGGRGGQVREKLISIDCRISMTPFHLICSHRSFSNPLFVFLLFERITFTERPISFRLNDHPLPPLKRVGSARATRIGRPG